MVRQSRQLREAGRLAEALAVLQPALRLGQPDALEESAAVYEAMQRYPEARQALERTVAAQPSRVSAWVNLAALRAMAGDPRGAAGAAAKATELAPQLAAAWVNLGSALAAVFDFDGAIDAFGRAAALSPGDPAAHFDLAAVEFSCGEIATAARRLQSLLQHFPAFTRARSLYLLVLHHATNDPAGLAAAHRQFAPAAATAAAVSATRRVVAPPSRLRVGLVSADFRRHSVWYFLRPLLERLPALGIDLVCFHTESGGDDVTAAWRQGAAAFVDAGGFAVGELRHAIRRAELDVLISLGGHTTGGGVELLLERLAPTQWSFLGYPGPIGLPLVDGWISDAAVAPTQEGPLPYPEQAVRLPGSYFCFAPGEDIAPALAPRDSGRVVFGSFNVLGKISAVTVRLWAQVLHAVADSVLVLKSDSTSSRTARRLQQEFAACGIEGSRLRWLPWDRERQTHLGRYGEVDIALDTFPYNGATTTCEALWMGVPVVSLSGRTPASRMGRSILRAAECGAWAHDEAEAFIACAVALAKEVDTLRNSRAGLRCRLETSPLMDGERYARDFAQLLRHPPA